MSVKRRRPCGSKLYAPRAARRTDWRKAFHQLHAADWFRRETHGMLVQLRKTCNGLWRPRKTGMPHRGRDLRSELTAQKCR